MAADNSSGGISHEEKRFACFACRDFHESRQFTCRGSRSSRDYRHGGHWQFAKPETNGSRLSNHIRNSLLNVDLIQVQTLISIALVALLVTPVIFTAIHGGTFRKNTTILPRRDRLVLFLQLFAIVYFLCLAYVGLIVGGYIDDRISFANRRLPIHTLWAFFGIPFASIIIGKIWFFFRYKKGRTPTET